MEREELQKKLLRKPPAKTKTRILRSSCFGQTAGNKLPGHLPESSKSTQTRVSWRKSPFDPLSQKIRPSMS